MTKEKMKEAQELSERIADFEKLLNGCGTFLFFSNQLDGVTGLRTSSMDDTYKTHRAIIEALNGLLAELQDKFEKL